jgi:hypothetical protein
MARTKKVIQSWNTMDIVAAACAAQRVNGEYVKSAYTFSDTSGKQSNRAFVYQFLQDDSQVLDSDRLLAENIKSFYQGYTFKLLSGDYVGTYDRSIIKILEQETVSSAMDIALLTSLPNSYHISKKRDETDRRIKLSRGGYLGNVGDRVSTECEIVKCIYSQNYFCYFVTAMTFNDQALFFSYKQEISVGKVLQITGTVKRQQNNQTQLNRVKVKE